MRIVFDPDFEQGCWPGPLRGGPASAGEDWVGPARFAQVLEAALGLGGPGLALPERAARLVPALLGTEGFWSASAEVDPFATARRLIQWRDTLAMCGWAGDGAGPRLAALAALTAGSAVGLPDRLQAIHAALGRRSPDLESVELLAPRGDLEPLWQRTLGLLERRGTRVVETVLGAAPAPAGTDLAGARAERFLPAGDGSLRLLRPAGPLAAAEEVAAWLAALGAPPQALIIGSDPALDAALRRHGLPTTGTPHELRDGVPLQILPLVLDLGWAPQDPQRAWELLSLRSSPVPGEVRRRLREALGEWPAVDSDAWRAALAAGLADLEDGERRGRVRQRLDVLWDARVPRGGGYPAAEVVRRAGMLRAWLVGRMAVADTDRAEWAAAASQCETLLELVGHSGLAALSAAQLRHLVIEATQGTGGASPFAPQAGMPQVGAPGGVAGPARHVVWWRFDAAAAPGITRLPLTRAERAELEALGVALPEPGRLAAAQARRWRRPLDQAGESLLFVCPEQDAAGGDLHPHPLWDELVSRVAAKNTRRYAEDKLLRTSLKEAVPQRRRTLLPLPAPRREWTVPAGHVGRRERESPSSVQTLLGCPFQWVLRYAGGLRAPDSAQVADGTGVALLGELLHAILNRVFAGPARGADEAALEAGAIFDREGPRLVAALFLPGKDAQRAHVRRVAVRTAHALYAMMAAGGLQVLATEQERAGRAFDTTFAGRVDLVLGEPARILDLKWSGAGSKRRALKEGTALQLAAYAFLECQGRGPFPPVGYFVMEAQRLLTTQPDAFHGAEAVEGPSPEETWRLATAAHALEWRAVARGALTARGVATTDGEPPPAGDARGLAVPPACEWCDYAALCGLAFVEEA